jgi:hypothetical protein
MSSSSSSSSFPVDRVALSSSSRVFRGVRVFRLVALRDFTGGRGLVRAGELGGWVESLESIQQSGTSWVAGEAVVFCASRVMEDALVADHAVVAGSSFLCGDAVVCDSAFLWDTFVGGEWAVGGVAVGESFGE